MPKLLNTTLLVTMSSATPESLGYGSLFASGSVIYFTSSLGKFDLTQPKGYIIVREYLTGATTTWAVPPNVKYVKILAVAGGGSGAGGAKRTTATTTVTPGGGGGAGGPIVMATFPAAHFTQPSYTVTVGAGANSAPGNSNPAGGNGTNGTQGGGTSLISGSNIVIRAITGAGETAAEGGVNNDTFIASGFTAGASCTPSTIPHIIPGWYGGSWNTSQTGVAGNPTYVSNAQVPTTTAEAVSTWSHAMNGLRGCAAGGAGGGMSSATALTRAGSGSGVVVNGTVQGTGSPGVAGTGNAGSSGTADLLDIMNLFYFSGSSTVTSSYGIGSGGCGGAVGDLIGTIGGGNGGDGADMGAAGGGGGACSTGSLSAGNGGAGGDGYMAIIEYY